jgi:hypothetical protein
MHSNQCVKTASHTQRRPSRALHCSFSLWFLWVWACAVCTPVSEKSVYRICAGFDFGSSVPGGFGLISGSPSFSAALLHTKLWVVSAPTLPTAGVSPSSSCLGVLLMSSPCRLTDAYVKDTYLEHVDRDSKGLLPSKLSWRKNPTRDS